jgi:hypothetical protein
MEKGILDYNTARKLRFNRLAKALTLCNEALLNTKAILTETSESLKLDDVEDEDVRQTIADSRTKLLKQIDNQAKMNDNFIDYVAEAIQTIKHNPSLIIEDDNLDDEGNTATSSGHSSGGSGAPRKQTPPIQPPPNNTPPDSSGQPPQTDQSNTKKPKLDSNTPIFKGGNVDNWLFVVNQNFALAKINNQDKLKVISSYLRGRPLQTLINFVRENPYGDWIHFSQVLKDNFSPINKEQAIRVKLGKVRHDNDFNKFVNQFLAIANQDTTLNEDDRIYFFSQALKPNTRAEVTAKNPRTLNDAIRLATAYENCRFGNNNMSKNNNNYKNKFNNKNKFNKKTTNSNSMHNGSNNNNRYRRNDKQNQNKTMVCFKCKKPGHKQSECTSGFNSNNRAVNLLDLNDEEIGIINCLFVETVEEEADQEQNISCLFEERQESRADSEYVMAEIENDEDDGIEIINTISTEQAMNLLPATEVKIGRNTARAILDTGASISIISAKKVAELKLPIVESGVSFNSVSHKLNSVIGKIESLKIEVFGKCCEMNFYVINCDYEMLLGNDCLKLLSIAIGWKNNRRVYFVDDSY